MNRSRTLGLLWGLVAWNAVSALAFVAGGQFGPLPALAGLAVGFAIALELRVPSRSQSLVKASPIRDV
jgi:hypothetical protein